MWIALAVCWWYNSNQPNPKRNKSLGVDSGAQVLQLVCWVYMENGMLLKKELVEEGWWWDLLKISEAKATLLRGWGVAVLWKIKKF